MEKILLGTWLKLISIYLLISRPRRQILTFRIKLICVSIIQISFAFNSFAQLEQYQIVTEDSKISFITEHMGFLKVDGGFSVFSGVILFDKSDYTKIDANVKIWTNSVNTNNTTRDKSIKSEDFLDAAGFPQMLFKSTDIYLMDENHAMKGNLTIKETTQPIEIPFSIEHLSDSTIKLLGKFAIIRSDYLLDFGPMDGLVSNEVQIAFDVIIKLYKE